MLRNGSLAKPVQWHEGMLLSPQHFQQAQIYNEQQLRCSMEATCPFYWGVLELEIAEGLDTGIVSVRRIVGVMPDGLVVDFNSDGDNALSIDLNVTEKAAEPGKQRWRVQLAIPRRGEASASSTAPFRRYASIEGQRHRDENDGEVGVEVVRLSPILSLSVNEGSDAYVRLGLIEVERADDGSFSRTDYVPPLLRVSTTDSSPAAGLSKSLVNLAAKMRRKAVGLVESQRRQGADGSGEIGRGTKNQIRALVGALVPFEFLAESGQAHPFELYSALGAVLGHVSSLEPSGLPPKLRRYDHDNLNRGFADVIGKIDSVVERVQLKFRTIRMRLDPTRNDPDRYVVVVPADWKFSGLWIEAEASPGRGRDGLTRWMAACRIVSDPVDLPEDADSKLERLRRERTLGVPAEPTDAFPKLGVQADEQRALFKVPVDDNLIRRGEQLVIACTDASLRDWAPRAMLFYVGTGEDKDG